MKKILLTSLTFLFLVFMSPIFADCFCNRIDYGYYLGYEHLDHFYNHVKYNGQYVPYTAPSNLYQGGGNLVITPGYGNPNYHYGQPD